MSMTAEKKNKNRKVKFIQENRKQPKVIKVDVTKASLTHAMIKLKYFKGFILLLHFLSGLPWKTNAPTQPGQIRIVLLARNLEV